MEESSDHIAHEDIARRAKDIHDTITGFELNTANWEALLDKYRLLVAQFNKLESEMKEETKMITIHPKDVDFEKHSPEWSKFLFNFIF